MITGIDISCWQGEVDFYKAKPLVDFMYARSSIGLEEDSQFKRNWAEAERLNIPHGAYHYLLPELGWEKQARLFASLAQGDCLVPMLDVEVADSFNQQQMASCVLKFCDLADKLFGRQIGIYTSRSKWDYLVGDTGKCWPRPLWVAHYTNADQPWIPTEWEKRGRTWSIWQWSADGNRQGHKYGATGSWDIDLDRVNGNEEGLARLLGTVVPVPMPEPTPEPEPVIPEKVMVNVGFMNVRDAPWGRQIKVAQYGEEFDVTGQVEDENGRVWYKSKMDVYVASWLTKELT